MLHFVPNRNEVVFLLQLLSILPGQLSFASAHVCEVGKEKDEYNKWRWVLPYPYPCDCTRVILGGVNTLTLTRSFKPVYTDRVFFSDDVDKIRKHYILDCQEKDTEAPIISCPGNLSMLTKTSNSSAIVEWSSPKVTDNSGLNTTVTCYPGSGSTFVIGQHEVKCEARDASRNNATCTFKVAIIDTEAPIISCPGNLSMATDTSQSTAIVEWSSPRYTDNSGRNTTVTCYPVSGYTFGIGQHEIKCEAPDSNGNEATCTFKVAIFDNEAPAFKFCPANQTIEADPGNSTALVVWSDPEATDNSGLNTTVTCSPESESEFRIGQTEVVCEARDASDNEASCSFTVNITACNTRPLGMEDGRILDEQLIASSHYFSHSKASKARLNGDSYWLPNSYVNSWIRINLLKVHSVSGIITQGSPGTWVEYVKIQCEEPETGFVYIHDKEGNNMFAANTDPVTPVTIMFDTPISTSVVKIEPVQCTPFNGRPWCKLRLEILGCSSDE